MIIVAPWEHSALIQQLLANLEPSERPGFSMIGMLLSPRQEALLKDQLNIFYALERGETIIRQLPNQKGD